MNRVGALALLTLGLAALFTPAGGAGLYRLDPDVVYGRKMGMALTYDVIAPSAPNGAGVLFMVSGGWISRWSDPEQSLARSAAFSALVERGFTLYLVRHGSSPVFKVPDAVADVRQALRHIRAHAASRGVDPGRLGVFGGSAGGHLSLMLGAATESAYEGSPAMGDERPAAVVAYFPPVDLQGMVGPNDRFPALDFDAELADEVSPLLFVSKDDPPILLIHGDQDTLVPLDHSKRIHAALEQEGVTSELIVIEGAGHGFRDDHETRAAQALVDWFERHLLPVPELATTTGSGSEH
ncbi:MAG TPA: alpha/beta hydrolase [Thermoanaerobaculia bacterium]|nr:alpha/beta hydrolase [Thermoanaerobaculia bacterium]